MTNSHISLAEFATRTEAKIISGIMVFSIAVTQTLLPYTAEAFDLLPAVSGPTFSGLVQANGTLNSAQSQLLAAQTTLNAMNTQFNAAQSGVLTVAMNQGLTAPAINLNQITNASTILPADALALATAMINEGVAAGALTPTQLNPASGLGVLNAEKIANAALVDMGLDPVAMAQNLTPNIESGEWGRSEYLSFMAKATSSLLSYVGPLTLPMARNVVGFAFYGVPASEFGIIDPTPYVNTFGANIETAFNAAVLDVLTQRLSGAVLSYQGTLYADKGPSSYQALFANTMLSAVGLGTYAALLNSLGAASLAAFQTAVRNAIHNQILLQVAAQSSAIISPAAINGVIYNTIANPTNQLGVDIRTLANTAVTGAIASGAVSLTALASPGMVSMSDMQTIVSGALLDTGLTGSVSAAQKDQIVLGSLSKFGGVNGAATVAQMQAFVAGEIAKVLMLNPTTLTGQMGAQSLASIQGTITTIMTNNVIGQLGSLGGALSPSDAQPVMANSILSTTGEGSLSNISSGIAGIPNLNSTLASIQGNIQGIVNGQLSQLTSVLSQANVQNLISSQMQSLTGLGDATQIFNTINPNIGQAFSSITQVGGQLSSINQQFTGALNGNTLGLNSLTSTFNSQLPNLTSLDQLNLVNLSGSVNALTTNLTAQITGPLNATIGNLTGVANGIMGTNLASVADLSSLTGSVSGISGQLTGALSGGGGIASLSGIGGVTTVSNMTQLPFGGPIISAIPCLCTPGFPWLLYTVNYAGGPGNLMYMPGRSVLYPQYQVYRSGPMVLGLYSPVPMTCVTPVFFVCSPVGWGQIITMVGTSI